MKWDARVPSHHEAEPIIREGLSCYAARQADISRGLADSFMKLWSIPITEVPLYTIDAGNEDIDDVATVPDPIDGADNAMEDAPQVVYDSDSDDGNVDLKDNLDSDSDDD